MATIAPAKSGTSQVRNRKRLKKMMTAHANPEQKELKSEAEVGDGQDGGRDRQGKPGEMVDPHQTNRGPPAPFQARVAEASTIAHAIARKSRLSARSSQADESVRPCFRARHRPFR